MELQGILSVTALHATEVMWVTSPWIRARLFCFALKRLLLESILNKTMYRNICTCIITFIYVSTWIFSINTFKKLWMADFFLFYMCLCLLPVTGIWFCVVRQQSLQVDGLKVFQPMARRKNKTKQKVHHTFVGENSPKTWLWSLIPMSAIYFSTQER